MGVGFLCGDLNMTEIPEDSSGSSPLMVGMEKESWRLLKGRFDLVDSYSLLCRVIGSKLTRREIRDTRLNQSRLDRFYVSDQGW